MKKRAGLILILVLTAAFMLTGCAGKNTVNGTETVATLDDTVNMELGELSLMLRYEQAQMDTYYGSMFGTGIYQQDMGDGTVYGDIARQTLLDGFKKMYILEAEAGNYGVELTEEEKAAISEAAAAFMKENTTQAKKALGVSQANAEKILTLMTLEGKMYDVLTADVDTEVSDEEAAQKRIAYTFVSNQGTETAEDGTTLELDDAQKAELKIKLQSLLDEVRAGADFKEAAEAKELTVSETTYGADSSYPAEEVRAAADALEEGVFSEVIETETGYYLVQMVSSFDREATDSRKETIVKERMDALYDEKCEELAAAHTFTVNEDVAAKLTFDRTFTLKTEE